MIEVSGLSKRYGSFLAVDNVSFSIGKGEIVGFLGPNGAGKSTIMNIITGYLSLTRGNVTVDGFDISEEPEQAKKRIGYLPEIPPLYNDMKVREYLSFIYDLKKVKFPKNAHIEEVERLVKIDNVKNRLIKNLSKGYRQRVGFAAALIGNPDILILDEPTVGLDPKQIIEIRNLISKLGKNHTIILSSHILSEIQAVCKRVIIINRGQIVADDMLSNLSERLSADKSVTARIVCEEEDMKKALSGIKDVASVESLGSMEKGSYDFLITPENGADIRAAVFERVTEKGKTILSLSDNRLSLERIFLKLTEVSDNSEAKRLLGLTEESKEENKETEIETEESGDEA